ncbi:DivIVA domain-containing protein [Micromonospora purpureochromogenes]|uniref:DivIVA domain-containing protein n=1 Tax=Micromonospora purpureochromogenes TaxID=47872 RepID=UPI003320EBB8
MIYLTEERLHPHQARVAAFDIRWRGLDPAQVHDYLNQMADELERLHRALTTANTEAERIRQALRQCQSRHTSCRHTDQGSPNSRWQR